MIVETHDLAGGNRGAGRTRKTETTRGSDAKPSCVKKPVKPTKSNGADAAAVEEDANKQNVEEQPKASSTQDTQFVPRSEPTPEQLAEMEKETAELDKEAAKETEKVAVPRELPNEPKEERQRYDGESAIRLYLREIGKVPLLTIQEEIDLAALIQAGDKEAREKMIKANLRLVVKIAHDYDWLGLPLLDLINEGNIGLMKAVERFDPAKGGKLSTYAAWWIKQCIKRALANQSKTIRLPVHFVDKIAKMRRVSMQLQEQFGREPTDEEIGEEMEIPAARVAQMRTAAIRPASLDAPIGDDSESNSFGEIIEDENAETPYEMLEEKTVGNTLQDLVKTLPEREATILNYRFGLDGGNEKTLEEVGHKFGVTRERVRQIQNIALSKLRKKIEKIERVKN